jgi:hypothetical protein
MHIFLQALLQHINQSKNRTTYVQCAQ